MKQTSAISKTMSILKKMGLLLFIIVGFSACQAVEEDYSGVVGIKAPAFTLFSTEGQQVQLFDYKDKLRHITAHQIFFSTLVELEKNYSEDNTKIDEYMFYFLEKWSNTHVLSLDLELAKELINNKVV